MCSWFSIGRAAALGVRLLAAVSLSSGEASAQPNEELSHSLSAELVREGNRSWAARDYLAAADRYDRAYEIERVKSLQLWAAQGLERGGKWIEAHERYLRVTELPPEATSQDWDAARTARHEAERLEQKIPRLTIVLEGALPHEVRVTWNGEPYPEDQLGVVRRVNPGQFRVAGTPKVMRSRLRAPDEQWFALAAAEQRLVLLRFQSDGELESSNGADRERGHPATRAETQRVLAYVAFGVAGAALLTGAAFSWMALHDESELNQRCPAQRCPAELGSDVDAFESKRTIGVASLLAGGALAGAGLALYFTAPPVASEPRVTRGAHPSEARAARVRRSEARQQAVELRAGFDLRGAFLRGRF